MSSPGNETFDVVFVLDGSGSIRGWSWELEKWGVANCFYGPNAFLPADEYETVAIAVVQFASDGAGAWAESPRGVPLNTLDSPATAADLATAVKGLSQAGGGTNLEAGLKKAVDVLRTGFGSERLIVVATDVSDDGAPSWLDLGRDIRRGEGYAAGLGPTRICTVFIRNDSPCADPPENTTNDFLRKLANTLDAPAPQPYLDEPIGHFSCAYSTAQPPDADAIEDFVMLCSDCSCSILYAGWPDCDNNGVPNICDPDCNHNDNPDGCDVPSGGGTSSDCDSDGVPDECQNADCNENQVYDPCDVATGSSLDCNENWIPDECEMDCNNNDVPDDCDVDPADPDGNGLVSPDCNDNGVPDECEPDCNENNVPDDCDVDPTDPDGNGQVSPDSNHNGVPDECEGALHVDQDAPGPEHDGTTWEKAFLTLHEALTAAAGSGGTVQFIFVAEGTYEPSTAGLTDSRDATFALLNNWTIGGGFAGYGAAEPYRRHLKQHASILSGDIGAAGNAADNSYHVLTGSGTNSTAILDGFTIIGGNANGSSAGNKDRGGGMLNLGGSPTVRNCRFVGNSATTTGGAMYNGLAGTSTHSMPSLVNCAFSGNGATNGGAIYNRQDSACTLTNCTIVGNSAATLTGGVRCEIGSVKTVLTNCIAWGNADSGSTDVLRKQISAGSYTAASFEVTYSSIADGTPGNGLDLFGDPANHNIDLDPTLALNNGAGADSTFGTLDDDLRVRNGSPCIDAGDNTAIPADVFFDAASTVRFLDDPATADTGNGAAPLVDIGAYEYDYLSDCNGNGVPDTQDITMGTSTDCDGDTVPDECQPDNDHDTPGCACVIQPGCTCGPDACDVDDDNDGVWDVDDNCGFIANLDQADCDSDGKGDACDATLRSLLDFDNDCDVDQTDFAHLQECWTGGATSAECQDAQTSAAWFATNPNLPMITDSDVVLFDRCASGPGIPAHSVCGDCNDDGIHDALQDFDGDESPDGDADGDGVGIVGRPFCVRLSLNDPMPANCDDNCPCVSNANQLDSDGDGIGNACDPTPNGPPPPAPPVTIQVLAWRSMREHGTGNWLGVVLDPTLTADSATIEPRQGIVQVIEADLSDTAGASSDLEAVLVVDDELNLITPNDVYLDNGNTKVVITFIDDPLVDDDFLLDQKCYLIDLSLAIVDTEGDPPIGDANCAIRMLAADVDGDGIVEEVDDEGAIEAANGQAAGASTLRMDIDTDGTITGAENTGADWIIVHALIGNTVTCSGGGMMMGMGGGVGLAGGADALVGTSDASNLLTLLRQQGATPSANVSAQWVVHGTGATSVTLPAVGGTILVNLVIATDAPIWGFEGKPAVDAANAVSINSADWTELDNVLFSHDVDGHNQSSYYDLTVMDWLWVRLTPDGTDVTAWGMDVDSLLAADPPTVWTLTQDLTAVNGPIATPTAEPAIQSPEPVQWFTTTATIGGVTREPLPAGQTVLATLSLTISAQPGTYHLTLTAPQFTDTTHVTFPATAGRPLEIVIQGQ